LEELDCYRPLESNERKTTGYCTSSFLSFKKLHKLVGIPPAQGVTKIKVDKQQHYPPKQVFRDLTEVAAYFNIIELHNFPSIKYELTRQPPPIQASKDVPEHNQRH
jgi:hypothetical protein